MAKPPAPFIAVDGEAISGDYVLLNASQAGHVLNMEPGGLRTRQCFDFLLQLPKPSIPVCFGLNYDVNMWIGGLRTDCLHELWNEHYTYWADYRLEWLPGKWFSIRHVDGRYVKISEVFGFFQTSFVNAAKAWGFQPPAEMQLMKQARGAFTPAQVRKVIRYCEGECTMLVSLMDKLRDACRAADAMPRSWIGAGSIAAPLLKRHGVQDHHVYDLDLAPVQTVEDSVMRAYFGGRVELLAQGIHLGGVQTMDLRSAYPAAATFLPSLAGARLVHRKRYRPDAQHAIWRVRWALNPSVSIRAMPFPVRRDKAIHYPAAGEGCYHAAEVRTAMRLGYPINVLEGWELWGGENHATPFDWLAKLYRHRAQLKAQGDPAEKALKLGLNSVYGKLAQGPGYKGRPKWQSYFWAGEITARIRARVLHALSRSAGPVMVATDGVFARSFDGRMGSRLKPDLGTWEPGSLDWMFCAQPGVYHGSGPDGEIIKSRGFFAREIDYDALRETYEAEGAAGVYEYESTRFVGLGTAIHRVDPSIWRTWKTERRVIALLPQRKIPTVPVDGVSILRPIPGPISSQPYIPKISLVDAQALDYLQGHEQPMRETI